MAWRDSHSAIFVPTSDSPSFAQSRPLTADGSCLVLSRIWPARQNPGGRQQQQEGQPVSRVECRISGLAAAGLRRGQGLQRHLGLDPAAELRPGQQHAGT